MNSPLLKESFTLAALSVRLSRKTMNKDFGILAKQLIRSGTSVGANIKEAQNAQSGRDFVHKLKIAAKELDETEYWLFLIKVVCNNEIGVSKEIEQMTTVRKILTRSIWTAMNQTKS